jgi:ABC-2 type transport system permease protein
VRAIAVKEFRQLRRDRRMLALTIAMPLILLVVFGYAASFDVTSVKALVTGPAAETVAGQLPDVFEVTSVRPGDTAAQAEDALRKGEAAVAFVADPAAPVALVDGSQLFTARAVTAALAQAKAETGQGPEVKVLFNPGLDTSTVLVPGLIGLVLAFVGTVITSLGVVRERQAGTLEQLAVMPFRPREVVAGKVLPYFVVAAVDMTVVVVAGLVLFHVPFRGSPLVFILGAAMFLLVTLGLGVLISTISENQGQAVMVAMMTLLPQVLLSGLIFPVEAMGAGVRWIAYILPLRYFIDLSRAILIRGAPIGSVAFPLTMLAVLGIAVFTLAVLRFRRDLAPHTGPAEAPAAAPEPVSAR